MPGSLSVRIEWLTLHARIAEERIPLIFIKAHEAAAGQGLSMYENH